MIERRTQAERSAESRARLIGATIASLAANGYARTSLVEIGRVAGLSRGMVNHHFGSKEACMQAVARHIREVVAEQILSTGSTGADGLDHAIDVFFELLRISQDGPRAMYVILLEGITSTPGLRSVVVETNAYVRDALVGIALGSISTPNKATFAAAEALAVIIEGALRGVAIQWMADPDSIDLDHAASTLKQMVRSQLLSHDLVG